jgi:hypothetical protein
MSSENTTGKPAPDDQAGTTQQASSLVGMPLLYADTIVDIQFGVFTSKIVFGVEGPNQPPLRVGVVVIPTAPLLAAARNILAEVGREEFQAFFKGRIEAAMGLMKDQPPPAGQGRKRG